MKTFYLIRHAKSDWNTPTSDFERPLNNKGKRSALIMAKKLHELNFRPNIIISSPAKRALQTSLVFANELDYGATNIVFDNLIYEASLDNLISIINNISSIHQNAILVGHNPGITELANYLTGNFISAVPTCCVIKIELEVDNWNEVVSGIGLEKLYTYPK